MRNHFKRIDLFDWQLMHYCPLSSSATLVIINRYAGANRECTSNARLPRLMECVGDIYN